MRTLLLTALATMALSLSACGASERTDQGRHADSIEQPAPAQAPADNEGTRNVPGGGSGTAAAEDQDSGHGTETSAKPERDAPPKQ